MTTALGALALIGAATPASAAVPGPAVAVDAARANGCPTSADVAGALAAQLGTGAVAENAGWRLVFDGGEERAKGGRDAVVHLQLRDDHEPDAAGARGARAAGDCRGRWRRRWR